MPILLYPLGLVVTGTTAFIAGNWLSDGWIKWLIIGLIILFLFIQAQKMGLI